MQRILWIVITYNHLIFFGETMRKPLGIHCGAIIITSLLPFLSGCIHVPIKPSNGVSYIKAVEIAHREASRLGYNMESMELNSVSLHSVPWNKWFPKKSTSEYVMERKSKLEGKKYWAVSFGRRRNPGQHIKGGSVSLLSQYN